MIPTPADGGEKLPVADRRPPPAHAGPACFEVARRCSQVPFLAPGRFATLRTVANYTPARVIRAGKPASEEFRLMYRYRSRKTLARENSEFAMPPQANASWKRSTSS